MEENGEKRVCAKRSGYRIGEVDRLTNLPECLLHQILLNLPTKDVVKCSVLSSRWRNLWRYVPGLDLVCRDFIVPDDDFSCGCVDMGFQAFVSFVDKFLGFNSESCVHKFRLTLNWYDRVEIDITHFTRWINTLVERKVKHLHLLDHAEVEIPPTVYKCESLVSLNLRDVSLPIPECVSLPSVKVIVLDEVEFDDDRSLQMLISGCPVLESLTLISMCYYCVETYRVCSQSLLSFTYEKFIGFVKDIAVVIDAPRLERLRLSYHQPESVIIKNPGTLVEADINTVFNSSFEKKLDATDLQKGDMIRNFLVGISCVKDMIISSSTLQVIHDYSRCKPLPLFRNLSFLRVEFSDYRWEMLPIFLESCPDLKSLTLGFNKPPRDEGVSCIVPGPRRFLTSLESVKIAKPMAAEATETKLKLVSYFLENSTILKKLTICLGNFGEKEESFIIKKLLTIPRLSSSCQVYVL